MYLKKTNLINKLTLLFFCFFPVSFLLGNFAINFISILICSFFLISYFFNLSNIKFNENIIYLLFFLFFTLIVNLYFSQNFYLSLPRVLKFLLVIILVASFREAFYSNNSKDINLILKFWFYVFLIVVFDIFFELIFGKNIFGNISPISGRLGSFTGDELNIGSFFSAFVLIILSYLKNRINNKYINIAIALMFLLICFLIGERANFVKTSAIVFAFIFLVYDFNIKSKIVFFLITILTLLAIVSLNKDYHLRYYKQIIYHFDKEKQLASGEAIYYANLTSKMNDGGLIKAGLQEFKKNNNYAITPYTAHRIVGKEIFLNYPFFGVGLKNFREESFKKKYENVLPLPYRPWTGGSIHPHQFHYELLAETGIFGYLSFLFFIFTSIYISVKKYMSSKNPYQMSGLLYVLINLVPIIPTGSFFSTYTVGLFWMNYALMVGKINKKD